MLAKIGSTYIAGMMTDSVEIPTENPGLSTTASWINVSLSDCDNNREKAMWPRKPKIFTSHELHVRQIFNGLQNITYEQRLQVLGLTTFETRMIGADLIQVFKKILNKIDCVNKDKFFFTFALDNRKGHSLKLYKIRFNLDIGKLLFLIGCVSPLAGKLGA